MTTAKEHYLGDGLYVSIDHRGIVLRAPRQFGDHFVALDDQVLDAFLMWLKRIRETAMAGGDPQ